MNDRTVHAETDRFEIVRYNYGHDWTDPGNVYVRADGRRWCAACSRIRQARTYAEGRR